MNNNDNDNDSVPDLVPRSTDLEESDDDDESCTSDDEDDNNATADKPTNNNNLRNDVKDEVYHPPSEFIKPRRSKRVQEQTKHHEGHAFATELDRALEAAELDKGDLKPRHITNALKDVYPAGEEPTDFQPEPQSPEALMKLPPSVREPWKAVIPRVKIRPDGKVDKLKIRIAVRGDLEERTENEDNSAPLASMLAFKIFLAQAARKKN